MRGGILNHPKGLFVLFFTEMWERFSFYGMRALLVLYMTNYLFIEVEKGKEIFGYYGLKSFLETMYGSMSAQALSSQIYGLYTGFVYLTPFFGGLIADRIVGQRKSVYVGGILMAIGHFLMAIESMFFPALLFLILGNGFFKPNISTQVGFLYKEGDPRRDSAFTLFYMGINLGAFFSPLVCGTLGQKVGWHYGFGAAGIGMLAGLLIYYFGRHHLPKDQHHIIPDVTMELPEKSNEMKRIIALVILCALNVFFWGIYEQQGNTLQLWADKNTDWFFLGWEVPSTWFQSFNPFMIFIFAPVLAKFWSWQNSRGSEPTSIAKMGIGSVLLGVGYMVMIGAGMLVGPEEKGSILWLTVATYIFTMGELYLSPIGLSFVTKVSPTRMVSMMMGVWFLSSFLGNYMAGYIGTYYEKMSKSDFFFLCSVLGIVTGLAFFLAKSSLNKMIGKKL